GVSTAMTADSNIGTPACLAVIFTSVERQAYTLVMLSLSALTISSADASGASPHGSACRRKAIPCRSDSQPDDSASQTKPQQIHMPFRRHDRRGSEVVCRTLRRVTEWLSSESWDRCDFRF